MSTKMSLNKINDSDYYKITFCVYIEELRMRWGRGMSGFESQTQLND